MGAHAKDGQGPPPAKSAGCQSLVWCASPPVSIAEQHRMLVRKLRGHGAYYGIPGNASSLTTFSFHVVHIWQKWRNRRSQKRSMPWRRFLRLLARYPLPRMTVTHSVACA